ncbi:MAG TPA: hypothetical protein VEU96_19360 [Bryobacteraceae bacterium]|nr:hypothetical protein [Bryobacteraceae bacterium]
MRILIVIARTLACACALLQAIGACSAQPLVVSPGFLEEFTAVADSGRLSAPQQISVASLGNQNVAFKVIPPNTFPAGTPAFVVVVPSSGVTPASALVALSPHVVPYLPPGVYTLTLLFSTPGETPSGGITLTLKLSAPPSPVVTSVVNAASLLPSVSPGDLVSIFGKNVGTPPISAQYDFTGLYPTTLGNTTVTFGGIMVPLLYVSTSQINAVVPYGVAGQQSVDVVVTHDFQKAPPFKVAIVDTSPAIFTTTQTGMGQGAILNAAGTPNSMDNPATKGSAASIFATGAGVLNRTVQDGSIILDVLEPPFFIPAAPVSLTIGGQPAKILYAGAAPYLVAGMLQVNAVVPDGIGSGAQPVVLKIGQNDNSQQQVTVAVQ